jgi:hypothetical protein
MCLKKLIYIALAYPNMFSENKTVTCVSTTLRKYSRKEKNSEDFLD